MLLLQAMEEDDNKQFSLKSEMDKRLEDDKLFRETLKNGTCPNCGFGNSSKDATRYTDEQHLCVENAKLKAEVVNLKILHLH